MQSDILERLSVHTPQTENYQTDAFKAAESKVLKPEALNFILQLHNQFEQRRFGCLKRRQDTQKLLNQNTALDFLDNTKHIRSDPYWHVGLTPKDLEKRYVEITGPTDAKMMINALNSGADVFMADFEDANAPTWKNLIEGQLNLAEAIRGTLKFKSPEGKEYSLHEKTAVLMVRPRGWHLVEKHITIDNKPISASLFDFGLAFFHNAKELINKGSGPYFYLPKIEHYLEARLWNDIFIFSQDLLKIPRGTIRATVLIETILAAFQMEEILYELKSHAAGLNAGRWDYLFSILKTLKNIPLTPDRGTITMSKPFMKAYNILLVHTCHKRKASAIGGMAAYIPNRKNMQANEKALSFVREDKIREASLGFDGTWVAHPDLVPVASEVFKEALKGKPNQKDFSLKVPLPSAKELLNFAIPEGKITKEGFRQNISVALQYLGLWLQGTGAAAINNLMEDAATAEISNAQLWQWLHTPAYLADGRRITKELYDTVADEELDKIGKNLQKKETFRYYQQARSLLNESAQSKGPTPFLTLLAYDVLKA